MIYIIRVKQIRHVRHIAAQRVQGLLRMRRAREELERLRVQREALRLRMAIKLESWWRGQKARWYVRELYPLVKARYRAAVRIQGLHKIRRARQRLLELQKQ